MNEQQSCKPAPQVAMVSDEMVNAALSEYRPMRAIYYPQEEMKAALQAALNARAGGDAKDAERYRVLRNESHPDSETGLCVAKECWNTWGKSVTEYPTGAELDALCDAALASQTVGVSP